MFKCVKIPNRFSLNDAIDIRIPLPLSLYLPFSLVPTLVLRTFQWRINFIFILLRFSFAKWLSLQKIFKGTFSNEKYPCFSSVQFSSVVSSSYAYWSKREKFIALHRTLCIFKYWSHCYETIRIHSPAHTEIDRKRKRVVGDKGVCILFPFCDW